MRPEADAIAMEDLGLRLADHSFHFNARLPGRAITVVVGPSGAGKSTLLNLLAGFEHPSRGRILIGDADITAVPVSRRPISLVFQDNNLFAHLDIFTNVALGIAPNGRLSEKGRKRVETALQQVGLAGFARRRPGSLSGGERQRAAFARALVRQRPLLLMDEPFAALDPDLRQDMADLLLSLHRASANSILLVTHHADEARRLGDHFLYLKNGHIAEQAAKADLTPEATPLLWRFLAG